jgi:DNA polymerase I-like protein with 3'-5' exonuclease and polymerase domains
MNVDFKGVQRVLDKIHETYRQYFHFVEENTERCRRVGYIEDPILGRKRRLGFEPSASEVANFPIQAGIASVMNQRLLQIHNTLEGFFPAGVRPQIVAQVHDSCLIETREGQCLTVESIVADVWAAPVTLKNGASFILPIDLRIGNSMASF